MKSLRASFDKAVGERGYDTAVDKKAGPEKILTYILQYPVSLSLRVDERRTSLMEDHDATVGARLQIR